jgi:hypothetical protein
MNRFNRFLNERRILDFVEHLTTLDGDELDTVLESIDNHSLQLIEQMLAETNLRRLGRLEKSLSKDLKGAEATGNGWTAVLRKELELINKKRKDALEDGEFRTFMRPKIDTTTLQRMPADQRDSQAQAMIANVRDSAGGKPPTKYFRRRGT